MRAVAVALEQLAPDADMTLLKLHSQIPSHEQQRVFQPPPPGKRKVVLTTNIAETSVTVEDVVFVVDTGLMKEKAYDPHRNASSLECIPVSQVRSSAPGDSGAPSCIACAARTPLFRNALTFSHGTSHGDHQIQPRSSSPCIENGANGYKA